MCISAIRSDVTPHTKQPLKSTTVYTKKPNPLRRFKLKPRYSKWQKEIANTSWEPHSQDNIQKGELQKGGSCKQGVTQEAALDVRHLTARSWTCLALVLSLPPPAPSSVAEPRSPGTASKGILWIETDTSNRTKNSQAIGETFVTFSHWQKHSKLHQKKGHLVNSHYNW